MKSILFSFLLATSSFNYDLHLNSMPGTGPRTMILFHGYGANYKIAENLKAFDCSDSTFISFNFPDYDLNQRPYDPNKASFGTINEILPALYVLKKYVVDEHHDEVDLFGFSAGGGVVVNLIAILNTGRYKEELLKIGIGEKEREQILKAIQHGVVILDVPLKSVEEVIDFRGTSPEFEILADNYRNNNLRPIDSIEQLQGLSLDIILNFQKGDEVISNRDDDLYIERLKKGNNLVVISGEGTHKGPHMALWKYYTERFCK